MMNNDDVRDEIRYLLTVMREEASKLADRIAEAEQAAHRDEYDLARGTLLCVPDDLAALRAMNEQLRGFHAARRRT